MAWFTFTDSSDEIFAFRLTDPALVAHARALLAGAEFDQRIGGTVVKTPVGPNVGWSYRLEDVFFFEMSTEVGDSTMRYIEEHLPEVGGHLLPGSVWTGWSSTMAAELRVRAGGAGADALAGTADADLLSGRAGDDTLSGGRGDDHLVGSAGADAASGGLGRDKLGGGSGDDTLAGNRGDDVLVAGAGADVLLGGGGRDRLEGGRGDDRLAGGDGRDAFVFEPGAGTDTIRDFADEDGPADDRIDVSAYGFRSFGEIGIAAEGADVVLTFRDGDTARLTGFLTDHALADLGADDFIL